MGPRPQTPEPVPEWGSPRARQGITDRHDRGSRPLCEQHQSGLPMELAVVRPAAEGIGRQVATALETDLTRGFLESEDRFRQIAEALHHIVFLADADLAAIHFV